MDAPIDIYQEFEKLRVEPIKITHIFLTHAHGDHIFGLYDLSHIYNLKEKINLIAPLGVIQAARRLLGVSLQAFRVREASPFEKIDLGKDSYAWYIPVEHGSAEAYAVKVKAAKPIFYAPEFRRIVPSSKKQIGDIEVAVIDGSSKTTHGQAKGHETIEEGVRLGKEIRAKKILFTNIGHKTDTHEKLVNFVKETGGNKFGIAFDGLTMKV